MSFSGAGEKLKEKNNTVTDMMEQYNKMIEDHADLNEILSLVRKISKQMREDAKLFAASAKKEKNQGMRKKRKISKKEEREQDLEKKLQESSAKYCEEMTVQEFTSRVFDNVNEFCTHFYILRQSVGFFETFTRVAKCEEKLFENSKKNGMNIDRDRFENAKKALEHVRSVIHLPQFLFLHKSRKPEVSLCEASSLSRENQMLSDDYECESEPSEPGYSDLDDISNLSSD